MISLELENLFKAGLSETDLRAHSLRIPEYLEGIEARDQGFYKVIDQDPAGIHDFASSVKGKYEHIVVLGIGGSALGTVCLKNALGHLYKQSEPTLHILDNIDPEFIAELEDVIDYPKTLFITISKSGSTAETLSEYFYFRQQVEKQGLEPRAHFVFITDPKEGLLRQIATEEGIKAFDLPPNVGGRFSVLTAVGLLPAALIGIDIDGLLAGARAMRDRFLHEDYDMNLPFQLATIQYEADQKGHHINVMMPYIQKLYYFADWFKQLLAESIGKNEKVGLTPIESLGATDQHSQLQLYNEGPNNKLIMFIETENFQHEIKIPNPKEIDYLKDLSFNELINTEKKGTADALTQNKRPNFTIKIPELNAEVLGELFMLFQGSTAFLGEYYGINAFNQPGVELSKKLTKEYLINS